MAHSAVASLTIANLATDSNALSDVWGADANSRAAAVGLAHADEITIYTPVAGTVQTRSTPGGTWRQLEGVSLVAARAVTFRAPSAADLRVIASGAAAGAQTIEVSLKERMD